MIPTTVWSPSSLCPSPLCPSRVSTFSSPPKEPGSIFLRALSLNSTCVSEIDEKAVSAGKDGGGGGGGGGGGAAIGLWRSKSTQSVSVGVTEKSSRVVPGF